jgi:hypothetical protein
VYRRLQDHLLARLRGKAYDGDEHNFTSEDCASIRFAAEHVWKHKVLRLNYTTYDLRREQDSINPRTHANIMVLAHEDNARRWHPFWYARVLGIFHVMVQDLGPDSRSTVTQQMDFLWVCWFGRDPGAASGWAAKWLPCLGFLNRRNEGAFSFLDSQE